MRGATAPTSGSSKWPSSGASQSAAGTQSESTKATSALSTAASPALRATDGPGIGRQPDEPGAVALGDLLGGAGVGGRVVHHDARQLAERAEQPLELGGPVAHRHDDRHVIGAEAGWSRAAATNAPADTRRRARSPAGRPAPTGAPARQRATRPRARSEMRKRRSGLPPSTTVPPS